MSADGTLAPSREPGEEEFERALRPTTLDDFLGQPMVREQLRVSVAAARGRGEPLEHVLLAGPPGLGKTTLASIVAHEMGVETHFCSGPSLERKGDVAAILTNAARGDVVFVDEIHRLNVAIEEVLYPAMEDFRIDIVLGTGPTARAVRMPLEPFTLVGATTRSDLLTKPLRDRFGIQHRLEPYGEDDLKAIVRRSARLLELEIDDGSAGEIARRSRGTPRVANRLLRRVRDVAQVHHQGAITISATRDALALWEVDEAGLERMDRELLRALIDLHGGGPVGLVTLAMSVGEEPTTVEEVHEPYLVRCGFVQRTPRGRVATARAYAHLGRTPPRADGSPTLF
jgi:Holliday junction DNA helicase RuvB